MFESLNSYLYQHKSISVPGLGTIHMETLPSTIDISVKNILPPLYYFRFDKYFDSPDREFFAYMAARRKIAEFEAIRWYSEFAFDFRMSINQEEKVSWDGVGNFKKDGEGNIVFESSLENPFFMQAVPAKQVIHQGAQHTLLVGDRERTNFEMNDLLHPEEEAHSRRKWWIYALVLGVLALIVLLFHFYTNGWNIGSLGNQQQLPSAK